MTVKQGWLTKQNRSAFRLSPESEIIAGTTLCILGKELKPKHIYVYKFFLNFLKKLLNCDKHLFPYGFFGTHQLRKMRHA